MSTQRSTYVIAVLVAAGFLWIAAWWSAHALFVTSFLVLVTGGVLLRRRGTRPCDVRAAVLAAIVGALAAAAIVAVIERLH